MKFRNVIFSMMLMLVAAFSIQAQESESPVNQGDFIVQLSDISTDGVTVTDLQLAPTVGYALTDQIVVGAGALKGNEDSWQTAVYGRYYLSSPFYAQGSLTYDSEEDETNFAVSGGVTGFLGDNIYVEPNVQLNLIEEWSFELGLNFGVRF